MRPLAVVAILGGFTACGLNLTGTGPLSDDNGTQDASVKDATGAADVTIVSHDAWVEGDGSDPRDAGGDTGDAGANIDAATCTGKRCGDGTCVEFCDDCRETRVACGDTCVSSCEKCSGRPDLCHSCTDLPTRIHAQCASLDGNSLCPEANSACLCGGIFGACPGERDVCVVTPDPFPNYCATCGELGSLSETCRDGSRTCQETDAGTFACR
jgi:hypothetical protein